MDEIFSVAGITAYIRELIDNDPPLQDIWVAGEVSNMKAAASGHWYFTIKDTQSQLSCVMFRSQAERQTTMPAEGDAINVHGRISVYEQRGVYQLYADEVQPAGGVGELYRRFEELKAALQEEGLFDEALKRPLPAFPKRIGVVTSPDAAAFRDIQNVLKRRYPLAEVILSPTLVQGSEAPPMIVQALERLNEQGVVDVILLCRGGGSIEDLWSFNDERVARAVAASAIPVVSGVGHETDFTIVDFVSDMRAPTPSAAAEVATPSQDDLRLSLDRLDTKRVRLMDDYLRAQQTTLDTQQQMLTRLSPERLIRERQQRIDEWQSRMIQRQQRYLALLRERVEARTQALRAANPAALLKRGYAIVTRSSDGETVTSESDAPVGTGLTITLHDGELKARVEDKDSHEQYKRTLL